MCALAPLCVCATSATMAPTREDVSFVEGRASQTHTIARSARRWRKMSVFLSALTAFCQLWCLFLDPEQLLNVFLCSTVCVSAERWMSKDYQPGQRQDRHVLRQEKIRITEPIRLRPPHCSSLHLALDLRCMNTRD